MSLIKRRESTRLGITTLASLRRMSVDNTMEVEVCDVPDAAMVVAIQDAVHHALSHLVGAWHVRLSAVDARGRWDFRVRGAFGQHVAGFLAAPHLVVVGVERQLKSFLRSMVPPLSVAPAGPVLVVRAGEEERAANRSGRQQRSRNTYQEIPPPAAEWVA